MRLIDADALVDRITDLADANRRWKPEYSAFCDDMVCMIEDTPFRDVDDLRPKGRWEYYSTTMQECSACKRHTARHKYDYCPRCGADMREG